MAPGEFMDLAADIGPNVQRKPVLDTVQFRVGAKGFATLGWPPEDRAVVKLNAGEQRNALSASNPVTREPAGGAILGSRSSILEIRSLKTLAPGSHAALRPVILESSMIKSFAARAFAVAFVISLAGCAGAPSRDTRPLKIASWNLEHLAEDGANGCRPRSNEDYDQLKSYADKLDADVVAFEEVQSAKAAARVFDPAKYVIIIEERPHGQAFPCRGLEGRTLTRQAVGFAIRKDLAFVRNADLTALQLGDPNLRSGVDIVVRPKGHAPIRLLAVHLKSGCASGANGEACAVLQRQVPVLEAWIDARAGEGTRFAVLGDFNRRLAMPADAIWADLDDSQPANADLSLATGDQAPKCDPRYKDFIDHIVLDRRATAGRVGFEELTYAAGAERPSDHCPVAVLLN